MQNPGAPRSINRANAQPSSVSTSEGSGRISVLRPGKLPSAPRTRRYPGTR